MPAQTTVLSRSGIAPHCVVLAGKFCDCGT